MHLEWKLINANNQKSMPKRNLLNRSASRMKIDEKNDPTNREKFKMINSSGKKTPNSRFWPSPTAAFPVKTDPPPRGRACDTPF